METIAFRATWRHAVLEALIKEIDTNQDLSRSAIMSRALEAAEKVKDWRDVKDELSQLKRIDVPIPVSIQAKLDEQRAEKVPAIRHKMFNDLKAVIPDLQRVQTPYFSQLLLMNYYSELRARKQEVGAKSNQKDLSGPDMVKRLVQILLLNRSSDREVIEKIKQALLDWEE